VSDLPPVLDLAAARALFEALGTARSEVMAIAYLDPKRSILAMRHVAGSCGQVRVPVRGVVADAVAFDAAALVIAHTHPSGDARPSERDMAFTRALVRGLAAVDVRLVDHLVIAGRAVTSLRACGVL
jgi:DNA repair protein RadC